MVRLRPARSRIRRLIITAEPNNAAMERIWMVWAIGMVQKFSWMIVLSLVLPIHWDTSTSGVVLSHWLNANKRSSSDGIGSWVPTHAALSRSGAVLQISLVVRSWSGDGSAKAAN